MEPKLTRNIVSAPPRKLESGVAASSASSDQGIFSDKVEQAETPPALEATIHRSLANDLRVSRRSPFATQTSKLSMLKKGPELTDEIQAEIKEYAVLANYPYLAERERESAINDVGWQLQLRDNSQLANRLRGKGFTIGANGMISTEKGLCCYLLKKRGESSTPEKYVLSFGGTTAGQTGGSFMHRSFSNAGFTLKQWLANTKNAVFGRTPDLYKQASGLTELINKELKAHGNTLETTGHSLGGGMASYAAAMQGEADNPMTCHAFCSAELGRSMQLDIVRKAIGQENQVAKESVNLLVSKTMHVKIKGDPVPNMHNLFPSITNMGTEYTVTDVQGNGFDKHINFKDKIFAAFPEEESSNTWL